jgi:hypothetical protein
MRKIIAPPLAAASLGLLATPALAGNSGTPPGPPEITGGSSPGAFGLHLNTLDRVVHRRAHPGLDNDLARIGHDSAATDESVGLLQTFRCRAGGSRSEVST